MNMTINIICLILNFLAGYWICFRIGRQKAVDSMAKDLMRAAQQIERYALLAENCEQELYDLRLENERLENEIEEYQEKESNYESKIQETERESGDA